MSDLSELWKALRDALLADDVLVALLGSNKGIYQQFPSANVEHPFLVLKIPQLNPVNASHPGLYRPSLQFDVYAVDSATFWAIYARLESAWSIPTARVAPVDSDNWRLGIMRILNAIEVGIVRQLSDGQALRMWSIMTEHRVSALSS